MSEEKNEWRDAMLDMFDRMGAESWPHVDNTPTEMQNALYEHVNWLVERERGCERYRIAEAIVKELLDEDYVLRQKR